MKRNLVGLVVSLLTFTIGFAPVSVRTDAQNQVVSATPTPLAVDDDKDKNEVETFLESWYVPPDRRRLWKGEIYFISLANVPEDDNVKQLSAGVMTNIYDDVDRDFADAVETRVDGNKFYFRTAALKGISYEFNGVFFKGRKVGKEREPILRGTLQRFVDGKPAGSFTGIFSYVEPQCMH